MSRLQRGLARRLMSGFLPDAGLPCIADAGPVSWPCFLLLKSGGKVTKVSDGFAVAGLSRAVAGSCSGLVPTGSVWNNYSDRKSGILSAFCLILPFQRKV